MKLISIASFVALFAAFVVAVPVPAAAPGDEAITIPLGYKRSENEIVERGEDGILAYC